MAPSRTLVAPGLRTAPGVGRRADIAAALAIVRDRPSLVLQGMIGFALRGGVVLLTLPILVLPTQVEVRFALGDNLNSSGLTGGFWSLVAVAAAAAVTLALAALYVLARLEVGSFSTVVEHPASVGQRGGDEPLAADDAQRHAITWRVFVVQALALLLVLLAGLPLGAAIGDATLAEILRPSSSGSIYARILGQVSQPLLIFLVALFVIEAFSAGATRMVLLRSFGLRAALLSGLVSLLRHPLRALLSATIGWLLFSAALVGGALAVGLTWPATRAAFLAGAPDSAERSVGLFVVAALLAGVYGAALAVCGLASALRSALWTLSSLGS